ncbi:hypothetical protein MGN01_40360 [Methylobacterium gnaphalii]|uniref:Uncharacterized protein n=1 Tax=Methylobacterium gnaphalii TaxID=1010610 RepID=A0A512JQI0_9HYPH|nr:hypothetical protein MGN01_40360 [Methylobacterium gnaphalii]GLS51313.1 hypothetical protein GCM10007885_41680 [Methylobacterium gnaphalii]
MPGRTLLHGTARRQDDSLGGKPRDLSEIVRDNEYGGARTCHFGDQSFDDFGRRGIKVRGGLVKEEEVGSRRPGSRERQSLLFPSGKTRCRIPSTAGKADTSQSGVGPHGTLATRHVHEGKRHIGRRAGAHECWALEDEGATPCADGDRSRVGFQQTVDQPQRHAFPRAVGTDQGGYDPAIDFHSQAIQDQPTVERQPRIAEMYEGGIVHP